MITELTKQDEELFEGMIQMLLQKGFGMCDHFLDAAAVAALRENLLRYYAQGLMHPAGVGRKFDYQKNTLVRGDVIKWIERETLDENEKQLQQRLQQFVSYLNQSCYAGINDFEFHYACYEPLSFYKRHLDQFKSDRGRKYSLVIYLNESWQPEDGGKLTLFLNDDQQEEIYPLAGRAVFFKSDETEHEVSPSLTRHRLSIAGWLKSL